MRAAAVFALGTYILNVPEDGSHSDLAMSIDREVTTGLLGLLTDGSPIVRQELACALHGLILLYEKQFQIAALRNTDMSRSGTVSTSVTPTGWIHVSIEPSDADSAVESESNNETSSTASSVDSRRYQFSKSESPPPEFRARIGNSGGNLSQDSTHREPVMLSSSPSSSLSASNSKAFYTQVWKGMIFLASDPHMAVAHMAQHVVHSVHDKVC